MQFEWDEEKVTIVTEYLDLNEPVKFTAEELKQLADLDNRPIVYDEDAPRLSVAQPEMFRSLQRRTV
mgnify:CR=1 FL=1